MNEVENHSQMREPQRPEQKRLRLLVDLRPCEGFSKNLHALLSLRLGCFAKNGKRMPRFPAVAKQRAKELSVVFQNFQFRVHYSRKPLPQSFLAFKRFSRFPGVQALNLIVVSRYNRFFARKIVISGPERHLGRLRNIPHSSHFKALLPE